MTAAASIEIDGDALDTRAHLRTPAALGIGVVGSGNIVANAHIPAYLAAGMRIAGIWSRTGAHAAAVAKRHGIERVYSSVDELLDDRSVAIVDIALPPDQQPDIAARALAAGKHVLAQKPLAMDFATADRLVELAEGSSFRLAVNQNGRFDPSINAARSLIQQGLLGTRVACSMQMNLTMPWQTYYRDPRYDQLMLLHMSVHHLDQFRWLFGNPERVYAATRRIPGDPYHGENYASYVLHYADGFLASSVDDGSDWSSDFGIAYRISGTDAILIGEIGWPHNRKSTLRYELRAKPGVWHHLRFTRSWFPDAFSGTMGELMSAVEEGRTPLNSGADNLETMRAVFAAYRSAESHQSVPLAAIGSSTARGTE